MTRARCSSAGSQTTTWRAPYGPTRPQHRRLSRASRRRSGHARRRDGGDPRRRLRRRRDRRGRRRDLCRRAGDVVPVVSAGEIDAVAPPHGAGVADVIVTAPAGTSPITPADQFHYVAAPGAPTKITAIAANRRVKVRFKPRTATGPVTYRVIALPGGGNHRDAEPDHRTRTAQRQALPLPGVRHQRRWRDLIAAVARGHAVRAPQDVAGVHPGGGPARPAHRVHGDRRQTLTQARVGHPRAAARAALRCATAGRTRAGRRSHTARIGQDQAWSSDDHADATRATHRGEDRRARRVSERLAGEKRQAPALGRQALTLKIGDSAHNASSARLRLRLS